MRTIAARAALSSKSTATASSCRILAPCSCPSSSYSYALRDRMGEDRMEAKMFRDLSRPQILAISDPVPPAGELKAWRVECLYRLIDRRYRQLKSTWMTINATSPEDAEQNLSSPVWDRLQELAVLVPCFWPSYRERKPNS